MTPAPGAHQLHEDLAGLRSDPEPRLLSGRRQRVSVAPPLPGLRAGRTPGPRAAACWQPPRHSCSGLGISTSRWPGGRSGRVPGRSGREMNGRTDVGTHDRRLPAPLRLDLGGHHHQPCEGHIGRPRPARCVTPVDEHRPLRREDDVERVQVQVDEAVAASEKRIQPWRAGDLV